MFLGERSIGYFHHTMWNWLAFPCLVGQWWSKLVFESEKSYITWKVWRQAFHMDSALLISNVKGIQPLHSKGMLSLPKKYSWIPVGLTLRCFNCFPLEIRENVFWLRSNYSIYYENKANSVFYPKLLVLFWESRYLLYWLGVVLFLLGA